jgi:hypothetical protein
LRRKFELLRDRKAQEWFGQPLKVGVPTLSPIEPGSIAALRHRVDREIAQSTADVRRNLDAAIGTELRSEVVLRLVGRTAPELRRLAELTLDGPPKEFPAHVEHSARR